jgi:hypothetical protein
MFTNKVRHSITAERKMLVQWGGEEKSVALIKSLITQDRKDVLEARLQKIELNLSANFDVFDCFS